MTAPDSATLDTRAGTAELAVSKLRTGSYFPRWLLECRRRAEQALVSVVATVYLLGVSTLRVEIIVAYAASAGFCRIRELEQPGQFLPPASDQIEHHSWVRVLWQRGIGEDVRKGVPAVQPSL